jgi:hypothetical protein
MDKRHLQALALFSIIAGILVGGSYYWSTSQIIADTSHPVINEAATTHGPISYGDGKPTLLLFFDENLGVETATVEIRYGGIFGFGSDLVEKITMTLVRKQDSNTYKYQGQLTQQLEQNTEYTVIYRVYDQSDLGDSFTTKIETVNLAGIVTVNGIEVKGPTDIIYVNTLDLEIQVAITQAANSVANVYGVVNGDKLDFEKYPSGDYATIYTLPEDGSYNFMVQVLDVAGTDTQLASFNIELGNQYQMELMVAVFGAIILGALGFYFNSKEKAKNGGSSQK